MPGFRVKLKAVRVFVSVAMSNDWIDAEGFRANVGIILTDGDGKLMLGGRAGNKGWQFPQGGMLVGEEPIDAMYRELREEVGLDKSDVELLGMTSDWLRYRLPPTNSCVAIANRSVSARNSAGSCCTWCLRPRMCASISATSLNGIASAG